MRDDIKQEDKYGLFALLYLVAYVLACGLGYFFGRYLFDKPIFREWFVDLLVLPLLYVVLYFVNVFVGLGLGLMFELFKRLNLPDLSRRLNLFLFYLCFYLIWFCLPLSFFCIFGFLVGIFGNYLTSAYTSSSTLFCLWV